MSQKRDVLKNRLNQIFRETFDDDRIEIFDAMTAKDLAEWDSLMHITLVVATEKEFGLELNADEVGKLKNVGEMLDLLEKRATC